MNVEMYRTMSICQSVNPEKLEWVGKKQTEDSRSESQGMQLPFI